MGRIYTSIEIDRPPEEVFDYTTTPANWPAWHASALSIEGPQDHSLAPGESVAEELKVAGRRSRAIWTVQEREAPHHWVITGTVAGGGDSTITYTAEARPGGTTFTREVIYTLPRLLAMADGLIVRRRLETEAEESLRRLKVLLEQ
ncbi:MAG TPA: SRPBCC family protein, partial [Chloroflexia bacterium]|nr:SRPBCC family protein [Chloroflexia bacterium]